MAFEYSKLRGKIRERFTTQEAFAGAMEMSTVSLSQRLNGKLEFTQDEIFKACELLSIEMKEIDEYFFTLKV